MGGRKERVEEYGEVRWRRALNGHAQEDFGTESAGQNIWEVRRIEECAGRKRKYRNLEQDTIKKTIVGSEIGMRAKAHEG